MLYRPKNIGEARVWIARCFEAFSTYALDPRKSTVERSLTVLDRHAVTPGHRIWQGNMFQVLDEEGRAQECYDEAFRAEEKPGIIGQIEPGIVENHYGNTMRLRAGMHLAGLLEGEARRTMLADTLSLAHQSKAGAQFVAVVGSLFETNGLTANSALPHLSAQKRRGSIVTTADLVVGVGQLVKPVLVEVTLKDRSGFNSNQLHRHRVALVSAVSAGVDMRDVRYARDQLVDLFLDPTSTPTRRFSDIRERVTGEFISEFVDINR